MSSTGHHIDQNTAHRVLEASYALRELRHYGDEPVKPGLEREVTWTKQSAKQGQSLKFDQSLHRPSGFSWFSLVFCFHTPNNLLIGLGLIPKIALLSAFLSKMIPKADVLSDRLCNLALKILFSSMQSFERTLIRLHNSVVRRNRNYSC
jgi:hypothetical protein